MSKLESILFDSDEGPASSLLRQAKSDFTLILPSTKPTQNHVNRNVDTTATPQTTSLVGSRISPSGALSPQSVLSDDHSPNSVSKQQMVNIIKLREQLQILQTELIEERNNRKRKEKSILKLAKELTVRSTQDHQTKMKMDELQETIYDLQQRLQERNHTIQTTLPELQDKCLEQAQQIVHYQQQNQQLLTDNHILQQQKSRSDHIYKSSVVSQQQQQQRHEISDISNIKTNRNMTPRERKDMNNQFYSPSLIDDSERSSTVLAPPVTSAISTSTTTTTSVKSSSNANGMIYWIVRMLLMAMMMFGVVLYNGADDGLMKKYFPKLTQTTRTAKNSIGNMKNTVMDGICAPVLPGTIWTAAGIHSGGRTYEAPWWVPPSSFMKEFVFDTICTIGTAQQRQRTRFEIQNDWIVIYGCTSSSSTGDGRNKKPPILWKRKLVSGDGNVMSVSANEITVFRSSYQPKKWSYDHLYENYNKDSATSSSQQVVVERVTAPWSSTK